ncbi:hypothetical protein SBV1_2380008 [Verrucomicrobia bacterium]|nr:hypothetical protein SBV1_2380008 [Verrucomicrobiota bacterium]
MSTGGFGILALLGRLRVGSPGQEGRTAMPLVTSTAWRSGTRLNSVHRVERHTIRTNGPK